MPGRREDYRKKKYPHAFGIVVEWKKRKGKSEAVEVKCDEMPILRGRNGSWIFDKFKRYNVYR